MAFTMNLLKTSALAKGLSETEAAQQFFGGVAQVVADNAKELAPGNEGSYIEAEDNEVIFDNPRHAWHIVEFGSVNNEAYSPLRRAVTASGLRLDVAPKP